MQGEAEQLANGAAKWIIESFFCAIPSNVVTAFMSQGAWVPVRWSLIWAPQ